MENCCLKFGKELFMSKIGEKPITVPNEVQIEIIANKCKIKGKEGEVQITIPKELQIEQKNGEVNLRTKSTDKKSKSLHGLYRNLIANAISGVQKPWEKRLEVSGTGYNVKLQDEDLVFKVGYSHPVSFFKVSGIKFQVEGNNQILISGVDKQLVGQVAHQIRVIKKPDVYKGKGIKYEGEILKLKPGKKTKTAEAA